MKYLLTLLIFIPAICFSQIDFSGVDAFWDINSKIKNSTATDADWNKVFATPYYKFYADWRQTKYMRRMITVAYSPAKQHQRDSIIGLGNWYSEVMKHLLAVDTMKNELQAFRDGLRGRDLAGEALREATPWLPEGFVARREEFPSVGFGLFQPDGNADESIAMDLKLAMTIDIVGFMAHEAHHFYTYKLRTKFKDDKNDSTTTIVKTVGQLQLEGIADMIDKDEFLTSGGKGHNKSLYDLYTKAYSDPIPNLRKVDSLLVYISKHPASTKANSNLINDLLPLGGHPHGYFMAQTILRVNGKKALLATITNQFDFIRAYNKAADKFKFSKEAMQFLARIEKANLVF